MDIFGKKQTNLNKIKPNKHLENCISIIYYMGLWPGQVKHTYLYTLYTIFSLVFFLGITIISEIAYIIVNWEDLEIIMAGLTLLMTNCTYAAKVIYIVCRHKHIKDLIDITKSKMFCRDNVKYERIITYYTWQGIFHHIAYQSFGGIAIICWGCTPIVQILSGTSKQLPTQGWYPYNVTSTPAFEITSSYQFVIVLLSCINNVAIDTLITGLIITTCCQLTLLGCNISSMNCTAEEELILSNNGSAEKFAQKDSDELYDDLKLCIKHSIMIFNFLKQIQNMFGTIIFLQLLVNCIIICLIAFNISQMKDYVPSELFGMLMYMCCMTYQIFIYCWHGNELYFHSIDVCLSAYANNWWNNSKNFKRALLIIMTRVQCPLMLTVGNIMELSLENFVLILRTSYSIFTVLKSSTVI
ncbi:unnamed protein product [Xylocopa violacea]|uniref:Odorant receptor n=1 Tax=Xylocopa violacea TaxID=135666 RepID=A0ABP1NRC1_XYLVO